MLGFFCVMLGMCILVRFRLHSEQSAATVLRNARSLLRNTRSLLCKYWYVHPEQSSRYNSFSLENMNKYIKYEQSAATVASRGKYTMAAY